MVAMDHRQRSLVAAAITSNFSRVQDRLRRGDSHAIVEVSESLTEAGDEEVGGDVIRGLVPCLPPAHASAVISAHPAWMTVVDTDGSPGP